MKGILLLFTSLLLIGSVLCSSSSTLEVINEKCPKVFDSLDKNYRTALKEDEDERLGKSKGFFSRMALKFFFDKKSQSRISAQEDLNELSQLYAVLNVADVAAIHYLKGMCAGNPDQDSRLCNDYPEILFKQVQNRLGVINSCIVHSVSNILTTPSRWLNHVITAAELMNQIDKKGVSEYRAQAAIISAMSPKQYNEFITGPNIYNGGNLEAKQEGPKNIGITVNTETVKEESKNTESTVNKDTVNNNISVQNTSDVKNSETPQNNTETTYNTSTNSTETPVVSSANNNEETASKSSTLKSSNNQSIDDNEPPKSSLSTEHPNVINLDPRITVHKTIEDFTDENGHNLVVNLKL